MLGPDSLTELESEEHYKKNMIVKMFSNADGIQGSRVESIGMSGECAFIVLKSPES